MWITRGKYAKWGSIFDELTEKTKKLILENEALKTELASLKGEELPSEKIIQYKNIEIGDMLFFMDKGEQIGFTVAHIFNNFADDNNPLYTDINYTTYSTFNFITKHFKPIKKNVVKPKSTKNKLKK